MSLQESVQCVVTEGGVSITLTSGSAVTIPNEVLQRSEMLRDACQIDSIGNKLQIVAPSGFIESWLESLGLLPTGCETCEAPNLPRLLDQLKAADFFQDEHTTATLADIIGPTVLSRRAALTDELSAAVQVIHKMSSSTVMGVLKASHASLHDQLALLPESLHTDVLLCAFPNIKAEGTICLETSLHTTASIATALATVPSLRGLKHLELMGICHSTHARPVFKQLMDALNTAIHDDIESLTLDMESEGSMALLKGVIHCLEMNTAFKCLTLEGGSMEQLIRCEEMQMCASLSKLRGLECLALTDAHCSTRYQRKAEDRIPAGLQCHTQLTRLQITMVMRAGAFAPFLSTLTNLRYLQIACMAESVSEAETLAVALRCMQHLTTLMLTVGSVGMASLMHCHRCPLHEFYVDPSELEDIEAAEGPWDPLFLHPALAADASVDAAGEQNGIHANPAGNAGGSIAQPVAEIEPDAVNELAGMGVGIESAAEVVVDSSGPQNHGEGPGGGGGGDVGADTDGAETAGDAQAGEPEQGPFGAAGADYGMQIAVHAMYDDMDNVEMNELNELQQAIEGQMLAGNLEADLHTEIALSDGNYASDGSVCRAVVESLQHLPELQTLHVACRNRHDSTFSDVCSNPVLQSLTSLQSLAIEDTSAGVIRVLDLLPSVAQLTRFAANVLSTSSSRAVVNIRDKLPNLTSLQDFNGCLKLCDDEGILRKGFPVFVGPSGLKELTTFHLGLHEICRDPRFNYSRPTHTETVESVVAGFMSVLKGPEKLQSLSVMFERLNQYRERDAGDPADSLKGVLGTISESVHLTSLCLDSAAVGDECAKALAHSVRALKSLKCLTCSGTFRDVSALESFCAALGGNAMSSLQILRLDSGVLYEGASIEFFTEPGMQSLLSALSSMNKLDSLMIDGYGISAAGMKSLAEAIPGMKSLQHLYLHNCSMTDVAATFLAQHVHHVKTLQSLDLSLNNFSDDGVRILAESIIKLPMIQSLKMPLSLTAASHRSINALCNLLRSAPSLVQLDLHCTALMGSYHNGRIHAIALMDALEGDPLRCRSLQRRCSWFKSPSRKRPRFH